MKEKLKKETVKKSIAGKKGLAKYYLTCYGFALPFFIIFCIFTVCPVVISILIGFTDFNMLETPKFVGVDNYIRLFLEDDIFIIALKNTFILAAVTGPVSYIMALLIAWIINELGPTLRSFVTVVFYAPSLSGNVLLILTVLWRMSVEQQHRSILTPMEMCCQIWEILSRRLAEMSLIRCRS